MRNLLLASALASAPALADDQPACDLFGRGDETCSAEVIGELVKEGDRAYLRLESTATQGFHDLLLQTIKNGNSVNRVRDGKIDFSLGCVNDPLVQAIVAEVQPVMVELVFAPHDGVTDFDCPTLASSFTIVQ